MTDFFDTKVDEFKKLFASSLELVEGGQFSVTTVLIKQMADDLYRELGAAPGTPAAVSSALKEYANKHSMSADYRQFANAALKEIKDRGLEAQFPIVTKMLSPDPKATSDWAASMYAAVWTSSGMTNVPGFILVTADKIKVMYDYEKDKCNRTARGMGSKTVLAMGSSLKPNPANYAGGQIGQASMASKGSRDVISYNSKSLDAAVAGITKAMSAGYAYIFGVLSGVRQDSGQPFPNPEHYILAFAQSGSTFLFWDPDSAVSNLGSRTWGQGFGLVHFDGTRLSTAVDQSDFDKVGPDGEHESNTRRHCYQVYMVTPVP